MPRPYQSTPPLRDTPQGALKWCEPCRRWGNHSTNECYSWARYKRKIGGPPANEHAPPTAHLGATISDKARPVLEAQPAPPGTTPLRLVGIEEEVQTGGVSPTIL